MNGDDFVKRVYEDRTRRGCQRETTTEMDQ